MFKMENYGGKQWLEKLLLYYLDVETEEKDSRFKKKYRFYEIDEMVVVKNRSKWIIS